MDIGGWYLTVDDDRGATSVEYALLAALIAGVVVAALLLLGPSVADLYDRVDL